MRLSLSFVLPYLVAGADLADSSLESDVSSLDNIGLLASDGLLSRRTDHKRVCDSRAEAIDLCAQLAIITDRKKKGQINIPDGLLNERERNLHLDEVVVLERLLSLGVAGDGREVSNAVVLGDGRGETNA